MTVRPSIAALGAAAVLATACQEPFGSDRHDLEGDRVAAVALTPATVPSGDTLSARVALLVDDRPWSDAPVSLEWHWLDTDDPRVVHGLVPGEPADATGPTPTLTMPEGEGPHVLVLVSVFPSLDIDRAVLRLTPGEAREPPRLLGLSFDPAGPYAPGDDATIEAEVADPEAPPLARWMTVGGRGTFLEQTRLTTRWDAAIVVRDDGEVVSDDPISAGPVTFVVLATDQDAGNDFRAEEAWVGDAPTGLWTTSGRWIGTDATATAPGLWQGVLAADDTAPTGLSLTDLVDVPDDTAITGPACGDAVPFDPTWLLEGRCLRDEVVGETVVVEVR